METNKSRVKNPTDTFIATLEASDINTNTQLFQRMLDDSTRYSKNLFHAAIEHLSQQQVHDRTLLNQLKACYEDKMLKTKNARARRNSFCTAPASIFTCLSKTANQASTLHSSKTHLLPLSSIPEQYNETDLDNDLLYSTSDHDTMYMVMINMTEYPTQYQSYQLQQALDDLTAIPQSPKETSTIKDRISIITTQRTSPFTTDVIDTLKHGLVKGLSLSLEAKDCSLQTNSPG